MSTTTKIDTGGPVDAVTTIFRTHPPSLGEEDLSTYTECQAEPGLTLLDHFAGLAMQAIVTHAKINRCGDFVADDCLLQHANAPRFAAQTAYEFAQAMIAEKRRLEGE